MFIKILQLDHVHDRDVHHTSHFISGQGQLAFRALSLGYCVSTLFSNVAFVNSLSFFTFFTNLSYILLTGYFGLVVYLSVSHNSPTIDFLPKKQLWLVNVLLEIVATNALFLDIVYWGLLYNLYKDEYTVMNYFFSVNVHLINLIMITTEVVTSKFKFFPRHVFFTFCFLVAYSIFAVGYYLIHDEWIYPILNWHKPEAYTYYVCCYVLNVACFFAMYGVHLLREKIAETRRVKSNKVETNLEKVPIVAYATVKTPKTPIASVKTPTFTPRTPIASVKTLNLSSDMITAPAAYNLVYATTGSGAM